MTISRFSVPIVLLMLSSCAENMPSADTELGRIVRSGNFEAAEGALRNFVASRMNDRTEMRREFAAAGFSHNAFRDERGRSCEGFHWEGNDWGHLFSDVFLVNICGDKIFTTAGEIAL